MPDVPEGRPKIRLNANRYPVLPHGSDGGTGG
jgi:hypothetical protein